MKEDLRELQTEKVRLKQEIESLTLFWKSLIDKTNLIKDNLKSFEEKEVFMNEMAKSIARMRSEKLSNEQAISILKEEKDALKRNIEGFLDQQKQLKDELYELNKNNVELESRNKELSILIS